MTWDWLAPILAFVGAAVGSGASFWAARRDTDAESRAAADDLRQREQAGAREEWGRRFTAALADISAEDSFRRRELGRVVIVELAASHLATPEERELADAVLLADARLDVEGDEIGLGEQGMVMDDVLVVEDDGDEAERSPS